MFRPWPFQKQTSCRLKVDPCNSATSFSMAVDCGPLGPQKRSKDVGGLDTSTRELRRLLALWLDNTSDLIVGY